MPQKAKPHWHPGVKLWYANIGPKGEDGRRRERYAPASIGPKDEGRAWEWFHEERKRFLAEETPVTPDRITVRALGDLYLQHAEGLRDDGRLSAVHYRSKTHHVGHLAERLGGRLVRTLTPADVGDLVAALLRPEPGRKPERYSENYAANICSTISAMFNWGVAAKHLDANPVRGFAAPVVPISPERFAERAEAAVWLHHLWRRSPPVAAARKYDRIHALMQRVLIHSGARPGELCCLLWSDIKWTGWTGLYGRQCARAVIPFDRWKTGEVTGKRRTIYVSPTLTRALRRAYERPGRHATHVFIHGRGRGAKGDGEPWESGSRLSGTVRRIRTELVEKRREILAAIEAGMDVPAADRRLAAVAIRDEGDDRLTNYRWRHTAASTLLMMGVDTLTVAELLGTSPEMIFRHYGHILDDHLATAASKLAGGRRKGSSRSS